MSESFLRANAVRGAAAVLFVSAACCMAADEPPAMFGGTHSRNMVSPEKEAATSWDVDAGTNIKWRVKLGSQTYAGPAVYDGLV